MEERTRRRSVWAPHSTLNSAERPQSRTSTHLSQPTTPLSTFDSRPPPPRRPLPHPHMLLQLPVELIQRIVRLAIPIGLDRDIYPSRQQTLMSLCRVHSLLRAVAQPILEETVRINGRVWPKAGWKALVPRIMQIIPSKKKSNPWETSIPHSHYSNLRELRLCRLRDVDFAALAAAPSELLLPLHPVAIAHAVFFLAELVVLYLRQVSIANFDAAVPLRQVKELTFHTVSQPYSSRTATSFLTTTTFPSLTTLAYRGPTYDISFGTISDSLSRRLTSVIYCIDKDSPTFTSETHVGLSLPFAVFRLDSLQDKAHLVPLFVRCRVKTPGNLHKDMASVTFNRLADVVRDMDPATSRLAHLSIPHSKMRSKAPQDRRQAGGWIGKACEARGIEAVQEEDEGWEEAPYPRSFVEYAERWKGMQ